MMYGHILSKTSRTRGVYRKRCIRKGCTGTCFTGNCTENIVQENGCTENIVQEHGVQTMLYIKNSARTCCTEKHATSQCWTEHLVQNNIVQNKLYKEWCTENMVQNILSRRRLYRNYCTNNVAHKILHRKVCTEQEKVVQEMLHSKRVVQNILNRQMLYVKYCTGKRCTGNVAQENAVQQKPSSSAETSTQFDHNTQLWLRELASARAQNVAV